MNADERARLRAVITASDETVDDDGGSPDPVAQRRVVDALARKARALGELGSYEQRIAVWDDLARLFADDPPPGRPLIALQAAAGKGMDLLQLDRLATALQVADDVLDRCAEGEPSDALELLEVRAFGIKRDALARMRREPEALHIDDRIIARFADAEQPKLRRHVNYALACRSQALWRADRFEDALQASRLLVARLESEPDESLSQLVKIVINDLTQAMRIGGPRVQGIAWTVTVTVLNCVAMALEAIGIRQARRAAPRRLAVSRQRVAQGLASSQAIISRLEGCDDPELQRLAATAHIMHGMTLIVAGHPRAGMRALEPMISGQHPGAIQAWQQLAAWFAGGPHQLAQLGAASALSFRADALGAGDPRIARIAYDDSLQDNRITEQSTVIKLLARGLRPRATRKRRH